jgi:hypothetical protein
MAVAPNFQISPADVMMFTVGEDGVATSHLHLCNMSSETEVYYKLKANASRDHCYYDKKYF